MGTNILELPAAFVISAEDPDLKAEAAGL